MQKTIILTFDDACRSHLDTVIPILQQYKFGATFFISMPQNWLQEAPGHYLTWDEIGSIHKLGFEIGNHTMNHPDMRRLDNERCRQEILQLNRKLAAVDINAPESFAYPGGPYAANAINILRECGLKYARTTEHGLWRPESDLLRLPSFVITDEKDSVFYHAAELAATAPDAAAIILYHGVPDTHHPWCNTNLKIFLAHMQYLAENNYRVMSMRDFGKTLPC